MIDAVYTWVDGAWPGYDALLRSHARDRHDLNPNRYRDNLSLLKYSLRSLDRFAPWIRTVVLVTCRPQVPPWLDAARVRVVHHDEFMPEPARPTFNSFAIVSHLDRVPGLSQRFLYIEDDRLFGAPVQPEDFFDADGRPRVVFERFHSVAPARAEDARLSPWNRALACSNGLLDGRYGARRRRTVAHVPLAVDVGGWRAMIEAWPEAFRRTEASRFRATGNVAPEHLYPHFMVEEGRARTVNGRARLQTAYHPLNNLMIYQRANLARIGWQRPKCFCLNDNFGDHPNPRVVDLVRRTLERWFPEPSRFEIR
jgi:hypothetical protein